MKALVNLKKGRTTLVYFLTLNIFWVFATTLFSYIQPLIIESQLNNVFWVGILMSLGAVAGMAVDTIASLRFAHVKYKFYYLVGFLALLGVAILASFQGLFPLLLLILVFGASYEIFSFGQEAFLAKAFTEKEQLKVTGLLYTLFTVSVLVTPFILEDSLEFLDFSFPLKLFAGMVFSGIAFLLLSHSTKFRKLKHKEENIKRVSLLTELKIWRVLWKDSGYILLAMVIVMVIDAFYWTLGPLFVIEYAGRGSHAALLLPLFMLPGLFVNFYTGKLAKVFGEGRALVTALLFGGIFLVTYILSDDLNIILLITLLSSIFQSAAYVLTEGILAHLIKRLDEDGGYLIGLRGLSTDIAYIIGPLMAGIMAQIVGIRPGFAFLGIMVVILAVIMLLYDPHKIKLSRAKIDKLEESD